MRKFKDKNCLICNKPYSPTGCHQIEHDCHKAFETCND